MIDQLVLKKLANGPLYARTFHAVKPIVARLIARGKIIRVAPPGGKARNMLALAQEIERD